MRPPAWRQPSRQKSSWLGQQAVLDPRTEHVQLRHRQAFRQMVPQLLSDSHRRRRGGTKPLLLLVAHSLACHHSSSSNSSSRVLALHSLQRGARQRRPAMDLGLLRCPLQALRLASLPQQRSKAGNPPTLLGDRAVQAARRLQRLLASPCLQSALGPPQRQQPSNLEQSLMPARRQATPPGGLHGSGMAGMPPAAPGAPTPLWELPPAQWGPKLNQGWGRQLLCPWGSVKVMLHQPTSWGALSGPPASGACLWAMHIGSLPGAPARGGLALHLPQVGCGQACAECYDLVEVLCRAHSMKLRPPHWQLCPVIAAIMLWCSHYSDIAFKHWGRLRSNREAPLQEGLAQPGRLPLSSSRSSSSRPGASNRQMLRAVAQPPLCSSSRPSLASQSQCRLPHHPCLVRAARQVHALVLIPQAGPTQGLRRRLLLEQHPVACLQARSRQTSLGALLACSQPHCQYQPLLLSCPMA